MAALRPLKLRYSVRARVQLLAIYERTNAEAGSPTATRIGRTIREAAELLTYFPFAGRVGRDPETREWVVRQSPYIIVYEIVDADPGTIVVLGIFHGKQDRP